MRILWTATKAPWPPVDGGRLLVWYTLEALAGAGHEITLVVPFDPARSDRGAVEQELRRLCRPHLVPASPAPLPLAAARAWLRGLPTSVVRHTLPAVRAEVARCLRAEAFDVVHAEQVQALAQCEPAFEAGLRVVWRAHNVESDLWRATAQHQRWLAPFLRREARLMAAYEGAAVRLAAATIAFTRPDAERLGALSGTPERIRHVPAPFPAELPPADEPLPGSPAIVLFGSGGWWPNAHGARWFLREAWPKVRAALPEAQLHVFGMESRTADGVTFHRPPKDSRDAFAPGSILVVPLFVASGVRVKILEAWARGIPVVATRQGAAGLDGEEWHTPMVADDGPGFERSLGELARSSEVRLSRVREARGRLGRAHDPLAVARLIEAVYGGGAGR